MNKNYACIPKKHITHQSIGTVRVNHTLGATPCDCVRLGNKTSLAQTDGISVCVDLAGGSRAAWTRVAGIGRPVRLGWQNRRPVGGAQAGVGATVEAAETVAWE